MKKEYTNPIIEIIEVNPEDIIITSSFDPYGILDSDNTDTWIF